MARINHTTRLRARAKRKESRQLGLIQRPIDHNRILLLQSTALPLSYVEIQSQDPGGIRTPDYRFRVYRANRATLPGRSKKNGEEGGVRTREPEGSRP